MLVFIPEVISSVQTPLSDAETAWLALDYLCIVVEAVEDLPQEDDRHQNEIDAAKDEDVCPQRFCQFLPSVDPLVILPKVPLIKWGLHKENNIYRSQYFTANPWRLEQNQFEIKLEAGAKEGMLPHEGHVVPER